MKNRSVTYVQHEHSTMFALVFFLPIWVSEIESRPHMEKKWKAEGNTLNENKFGFHWQQSFSILICKWKDPQQADQI